ncbi:unnamed protein product [Paramecium pentaurelia]|uniref:Uncharacterized protein n=1 Tax=Paramecium pentaurelia TaxID=43138 RepID=A0A8S1S1P1_9CILI|nr:unnamed protein product [Paramecium pentaurelia]
MSQNNIQTSLAISKGNFAFCLSNDEKLLIIIQNDRLISYELSTGKQNIITLFDEINLNHTKICISSDNSICCASAQATINGQLSFILLKFDLQKKLLSETYLNYHLMQVELLEFIPNSQILISLSIDATIKLFDFAYQKPRTILTRCQQRPVYCRLIQNQNRLIIIDNLSNIKLLDAKNERLIKSFKLKQGNCHKAIADENGIIALLGKSKKCYLYNLPKQKIIRKYQITGSFNLFKVLTDYIIFQDNDLIMLINIATCQQKSITLKDIQNINNMIFQQNLDKLILSDWEQIHIFENILYFQEQ